MKQYLEATLKSVSDSGAFTAIASMPTLDRDREVILKGAFLPLPDTIPVHFGHDFNDPVGRARPRYDGEALLVDGWFGRSARAQEVRQMTVDGILGHVSVGFMDSKKEMRDGIQTIVSGELLEVSLVSIPSNREAAVLSVRGYQPVHPGWTPFDPYAGRAGVLTFRAHLAALQAELALLDSDDATIRALRPPADPADLHAALADAKQLLAELARPPGSAKAEVSSKAAPPARNLFDVMVNRKDHR